MIQKESYLKILDIYDEYIETLRPSNQESFNKLINVVQDSLMKFINSESENKMQLFAAKKTIKLYEVNYYECHKKIMQMDEIESIQNKMKFVFITENKSYIEWYLNNILREMELDHALKYSIRQTLRQEPDEYNHYIMKKIHNVSIFISCV